MFIQYIYVEYEYIQHSQAAHRGLSSSAPAVQLIHLLRRLKERVGSPIKREVWQKKGGDDDDDDRDGDGGEEEEDK